MTSVKKSVRPAHIKLSVVVGLALSVVLPSLVLTPAMAQDYRYRDYKDYDGYCYEKQRDAKRDGAVIGAVAGGAIGGSVSNTHNKGLGTVIGAVLGAAVGSNAGKSSSHCYNDNYYSYQGAYYDPPEAPDGYVTVFFHDRPANDHYHYVYYDDHHKGPPPPDRGWRDDRGGWHDGAPPQGGWKDDHGYWHGPH